MTSYHRILASLSFVALAPTSARPQAPADSSRVAAYHARLLGVYDAVSGEPVPDVEVTDMLSGLTALTTKTGTVSLAFLPAGGSLVRIRKLGYGVQTMTVPIGPRDTVPITVVLERATELPAVVTRDEATPHYISPALRGFEERRKRGFGHFIDEATLRKNEGEPLGNLLVAKVPGAQVRPIASAMFLLKSPRCTNGGQPDVYLDGVPLAHEPDLRWPRPKPRRGAPPPTDNRDVPIDLSQFQVAELGAVEFYADNEILPIEFNHTAAGCGALLLWTRER